jgi:hypothetical protein
VSFSLTAAVVAVVTVAVFGPVAHDGGAIEPSHGGLSVAMRLFKVGECVMGK